MRAACLALLLSCAPALAAPKVGYGERRAFLRAVRAHLKAHTDNGVFELRDDTLDREWFLRLIHVHRDRVGARADGTYHVCVDFQQSDGARKVDVDFYGRPGKDGAWTVDRTAVHRVDGRARFLYNDQGEAVPAE